MEGGRRATAWCSRCRAGGAACGAARGAGAEAWTRGRGHCPEPRQTSPGDTQCSRERARPIPTLTAHREGHRQQVWLLEGLVLHFAGDLDTICLARGHQGVAAGDRDCADHGPGHLGLSGLSAQGREPGDAGGRAAPSGDAAGHGHGLGAGGDLLRIRLVVGLGWEENRGGGHSSPADAQQTQQQRSPRCLGPNPSSAAQRVGSLGQGIPQLWTSGPLV